MYRLLLCCCLVTAGCNSKPAPTIDTVQTSVYGGLYEFEIEKYSSTNSGMTSSRSDDGAGKIDEKMEYEIGEHRIKLVNGALSLNGKNCGTLQKGDKVRFTVEGKLYVNGQERIPQ